MAETPCSRSLLLASAGSAPPTTRVGATLRGDDLGTSAGYRLLWRNNLGRPVLARVQADAETFGGAQALKVALSDDLSDGGRVDRLDASRTVSDAIWVESDDMLYAASGNTAATLASAVFRLLVFDPGGSR